MMALYMRVLYELRDKTRARVERPAWALWQCTMRNAKGYTVASLHGIDLGRDGTPDNIPYARVVQAELALEGIHAQPRGRGDTYWHLER